MKRDESLFIEDILDYIEEIEKSVKNLTFVPRSPYPELCYGMDELTNRKIYK